MKLVIQIPCYNEADSLGITLSELPRQVPGFGQVEWLVINDGSTDDTVGVARRHGVDHIVDLPYNCGLARAYTTGMDRALAAGADVIVNTDGDNQYCAADIPKLVEPILEKRADIVIGSRPIQSIEHFSPLKKMLQRLGSAAVRNLSGTGVVDATSGFRAVTREAALRQQVFSSYTYTLETIIHAGASGLRVVSVPIRVNGELRPSRLVKSIPNYVRRSLFTILRIYMLYRPLRFFLYAGAGPLFLGLVLAVRWVYLNVTDFPVTGRLHIPSLVVAAILLLSGLQLWLLGLVTDLMAANRRMMEEMRIELRRRTFASSGGADPASER